MVTDVPRPVSLVTRIRPPCFSTIWWEKRSFFGLKQKALPGFRREGLQKITDAYCAAKEKLASAVAFSATVTFISLVPRRSCHTSTV